MRNPARQPHEQSPRIVPGIHRAAADETEQTSDISLIKAISQGSTNAFAVLYDRTSNAVRAELAALSPEAGRRNEVLAASYLEVWWLAGCHPAPGPELDVLLWIIGVVRRRIAETRAATGGTPAGRVRPSHAELELATLLQRPVTSLGGK